MIQTFHVTLDGMTLSDWIISSPRRDFWVAQSEMDRNVSSVGYLKSQLHAVRNGLKRFVSWLLKVPATGSEKQTERFVSWLLKASATGTIYTVQNKLRTNCSQTCQRQGFELNDLKF